MDAFYEDRPEKLFIGEMTHYPFPLHVHSLAEMLILIRGAAELTIEDRRYALRPGDAVIVFPLVPHSFDALSEDVQGVTAIFPPDIIAEYAGTLHGMKPECPVLPAEETCVDLRLAVDRLSHLRMEEDLPLCVAQLHVLLAGILHSLTYRPVYDYSRQDLGQRIMAYISAHAFEEVTQDSAAHALGISTSQLSHFFSDQMHTHFRRFINAMRVDRARHLMRDPTLTLTEICGRCGYTNMRTFRRAFQTEMGCLPSEHLQALRNRTAGDA